MIILKVGGGAGVDHDAVLKNLAARIQNGEQWVLVHGASDATNKLTEQLGYEAQTITSPGGHTSRYTDARIIEIFSAAAGSVNQQLTATLTGHDIRAVGLAGPNIIFAERKKAIRAVKNGRQIIIRDDFSGKITGINADVLTTLLDNGFTPVIAPLAIGEEGERLNVDGDLVAANIAAEMKADTLIILSNVPGLMRDLNQPDSVVDEVALSELDKVEGFAEGRMKKKLIAAQTAGISRVILGDSRLEAPLDAALDGGGTHIIR